MATIKSYTDISQSETLRKLLPLESADMNYLWNGTSFCKYPVSNQTIFKRVENIPCWSLAALLDILAKQDFIIKSLECNNEYQYNIDIPSRHCKIWFSSLLDAAFEMVVWLKKES